LHLTEPRKNRGEHSQALARSPTEPFIDVEGIHYLEALVNPKAKVPVTANSPCRRGITRQYAMFFEPEGGLDESGMESAKNRAVADKGAWE